MELEDATNPMQGVSGPGKFAKRTDLQFQPTEYGQGVEYDAQKAGAPLASTPDVRGATATEVRQAVETTPVTGLFEKSQRPDEPVTTGIDRGDGRGSDALMMRQPDDSEFRTAIQEYMPVIAYVASLPSTSPETRRALRQLRDQL